MSQNGSLPVYHPPQDRSQAELKAKAETFYKENRPAEYRKMKLLRTLDKACENKADAAKDFANSLIAGGVPASEAWNRAIRQEILESETD